MNKEKEIYVYNFYTYECQDRMKFTGHMGKIMSIDWFQNDMGFATCGLDGNIYFYDLYSAAGDGERNRAHEASRREVKFTSVVNLPGKQYEFLAVGSEKTIFTMSEQLKMIPRPTSDQPNPAPILPEL